MSDREADAPIARPQQQNHEEKTLARVDGLRLSEGLDLPHRKDGDT